MGSRDLLNLVAFQIVPRENHTIVLLAGFQNSPDIDRGQIDSRWGWKLWQSLKEGFTAHATSVNVQRDTVHPSQHHVLIPQLA